jgi:hypothetical protein
MAELQHVNDCQDGGGDHLGKGGSTLPVFAFFLNTACIY